MRSRRARHRRPESEDRFLSPLLRVNGTVGFVETQTALPTTITLDSPSTGPSAAAYCLFVWASPPGPAFELRRQGALLGSMVNPTPLHAAASPQPVVCVHGSGIPLGLCGGTAAPTGPARTPWTIRRAHGFATPRVLTMQGIIQDDGAANALHFSVTNAVVIRVE
ncbi:MAG: hypothetical protein HYR85_13735 [Planctomycetes bacterium]|nr:hypothetical protein [Planctomycetota bacterium]MBI3845152.1 hypothetical protein [Planctomycetota bacterium]